MLNFTIENCVAVKIRLNNTIGYSEYSNELLVCYYKPQVIATNPILTKTTNEPSSDILKPYTWLLNIIVLVLIILELAIFTTLLIYQCL